MGGDRRFYYPKYVWTPSGGWWNHTPKGYKKSFVITLLALGALSYATFTVSANNERRPIPPNDFIPSQLWARYAGNDDPRVKAPYKEGGDE